MFGNTVFFFVFHHSISGVVTPIRPQADIKPMFLISHILGASLLAIEGVMAFLAFSAIGHGCHDKDVDLHGVPRYPCRIEKLFNENFANIPFIG